MQQGTAEAHDGTQETQRESEGQVKIALKKAEWSQNINAAGDLNKQLVARQGVSLWYLGHGVLVEWAGHPDKLVPVSAVVGVEAAEQISADEWAGGPAPARPEVVVPSGALVSAPPAPPMMPAYEAVGAVVAEAERRFAQPKKAPKR